MNCSKRTLLYTLLSIIISVICCLFLFQNESEEQSYTTSVAGMEKLLTLEAGLLNNLSNYAVELETKLNVVRGALIHLQAENQRTLNQTENYLSNPLNAFSLIRRMHQDWNFWAIYMNEPIGWSYWAFIRNYSAALPSQSQLLAACLAIKRLQDVYNLLSVDMARGLLNGKQYNTSLNALDTFELGLCFHKQKEHQKAREWFSVTQHLLINNKLYSPIAADQGFILYYVGQLLVNLKYHSIARPIIKFALKLNNSKFADKLKLLDAEIEKFIQQKISSTSEAETYKRFYKIGCRGEFKLRNEFHCLYKFGPSPFLRLAPLKMEFIMLDPLIVVFYDVLSPREIHKLQSIAGPLLKHTGVFQAAKNIFNKTPTAKGTSINREYNNLTRTIARRIEHMTDLILAGSESLQISHYELGGHYAPHYDYLNIDEQQEKNNRLATLLFYLTKVEQGGATVFLKLQQSLTPEPGMAVLWHNLHEDGTPNKKTLHATCPVLVGSKWVMTQWIKERAQIYARPCLKR